MAKILGEKRNITDNVFEFEKRLQSPYNRYIDRSPTFVTYYHISNIDTTVNEGFKDSEELLGEQSSLRFHKIEDFPLYGIQQIVIDLNEDDQGLDGSYDGEAIFLPHTIKPYPNDFFVINHLRDSYLFRITAIEFDNIHPDNYYKANFMLNAVDQSAIDKIDSQIVDQFTCITENIGTDEQCIIQTERYSRIQDVKKMYDDIAQTYISIFYNERYNCLLGDKTCGKRLYDPFLIEFVNKWGLFNDKSRLNTYIFSQEIEDTRFSIKYEKSVWRFIERNRIEMINNFFYFIYPAVNLPYTTFSLWHDATIFISDISLDMNSDELCDPIFSNMFVDAVKNDKEVDHQYAKLLKSYIRKDKMDIYSVPLTLDESMMELNGGLDFFFVTPIVLYIIRNIIERELRDNSFFESSSLTVK